jgi:prepilin-type N-terminal cleavage/methylation domain-containing protein
MPRGSGAPKARAFTLLEIMIVVAIMGILVTMGVPIVYKAWKRAPMGKALADFVEVCSHARAQAIMQGKEVDLVLYPQDGRFSVGASGSSGAAASSSAAHMPLTGGALAGSGTAGQFPPEVRLELVDVNKVRHDFLQDERVNVRFFPNGTCDELTIILVDDRGQRRAVMLEVTTGLAMVESDVTKVR